MSEQQLEAENTLNSGGDETGERHNAATAPLRDKPWHQEPITIFTGMVALFTLVLAIIAGLNVWAFMESEGADLVVDDIAFPLGEPSLENKGLDVIVVVRNFGKHSATIREFNITPTVFIVRKELPDLPEYHGGSITAVVPPIAPGKPAMVYGHKTNTKFAIPTADVIKGAKEGDIPIRIYGYIRYYSGYSLFGPTEIGYCFSYVPAARRHSTMFEPCDNSNYTYKH